MPAVTERDATTVYPPNLTKVQWSLLEQLAAGWMLVDGAGGRMDMHPDGSEATAGAAIRYGRFSKQSVQAMRRRGYIIRYATPASGYYISPQGRAALVHKPAGGAAMTSIFEAMGGYEGTQDDAGEQAKPKRRRVDEYTPRLTPQQWRILEALADGAMFSTEVAEADRLCMLIWSDTMEWYHRSTPASLEKRGLIVRDGILYQITDAGRHALRIREQNKPGQI